MNEPVLTSEQQAALQARRGFVQGSSYVLMSIDVYREMLGVGDDEEFAASIKAVEEGLADVAAGRTRPYREVLAELANGDET
jgi:hypothetical protein